MKKIKNENREIPPIPVEWLQHKVIELVCGPDRKFGSDDTCIVFALIDLWRKEKAEND